MIIEDGKGTGSKARVDANNRLHTESVTETTEEHQVGLGDAYNLNTGPITLTGAGTLLYIKNNENQDLSIPAIVVATGDATNSDIGEIFVERNPTGGDIISDATAVDMNENRDFGSNKTLTADVFKGKTSGTSTGGDDIILIFHGSSARVFATINLVLTKGSTMTIRYDPKLVSGNIKVYAALICFLKDPLSED